MSTPVRKPLGRLLSPVQGRTALGSFAALKTSRFPRLGPPRACVYHCRGIIVSNQLSNRLRRFDSATLRPATSCARSKSMIKLLRVSHCFVLHLPLELLAPSRLLPWHFAGDGQQCDTHHLESASYQRAFPSCGLLLSTPASWTALFILSIFNRTPRILKHSPDGCVERFTNLQVPLTICQHPLRNEDAGQLAHYHELFHATHDTI